MHNFNEQLTINGTFLNTCVTDLDFWRYKHVYILDYIEQNKDNEVVTRQRISKYMLWGTTSLSQNIVESRKL